MVTDTRKIEQGVLFVALKGERFNGEDFAAEALKKGRLACWWARTAPKEIRRLKRSGHGSAGGGYPGGLSAAGSCLAHEV